MPTTITDIETTLHGVWSGKTLTTLDKGAVSVPVFVDYPDPEEFSELQYPSITILLRDIIYDPSLENTNDRTIISTDTSSAPYVTTMRRNSVWYRIAFAIHAHSLDAAADRALTRWVESRLLPRDSITVSGGDSYWIFRKGFNVLDEIDVDEVRYRKAWNFEVLADIEDDDNDETEKLVHEVHFTSGLVETLTKATWPSKNATAYPVNSLGQKVSAGNAVFHKHRKFAFKPENPDPNAWDENDSVGSPTEFWFPDGP